ncbi:MAG: DUF2207 domain-containing protein [Cryobacterium sp.]|nr:DUF2207 domain-containing protein [Cryobacterium sp.]
MSTRQRRSEHLQRRRPPKKRAASLTALLAAATVALSTLLVAAPAPPPAYAGVDDFYFESFHSDYYLGRDAAGNATLRTVETIVAVFPEFDQNRGILRAIPLQYGDVDLEISRISVTDRFGDEHPWQRETDGGFAVIRVGSASRYVHGTQTYVVEYSQRNVVRSFSDTASDEFYWDVNGTGWRQPFDRVSMTLHLEDGIDADLTGASACYFGYEGSTDRCDIVRTATGFEASVSELLPWQTMTIAVGFDPDAFVDPPIFRESWVFTVLPWLLLIGSAATWLFALLWRVVKWRDHPGRGIIVPQYTPLPDAYPALAAHLLDRKKAALPAQLIDFAVNDVIKIRENLERLGDNRWEIELLVDPSELEPERRKLLQYIFDKPSRGRRVTLAGADRKLGDRLAKATTELEKRLSSRGWMAKPSSKLPRITGTITGWIVVISIALWAYSFFAETDSPLLWIAPWACFFLWIFTSGAAKPPYLLTESGAAARDYLYGIRDYLQLAEADRIRMLQGPETAERIDVTDRQAVVKLYERLLGYAVVFGVERQWLGELAKDYEQYGQPEWAKGTRTLYSIDTFSHSIASTRFAVTPPVSTSSGGSSWSSSDSSSFSGGSSGGGSSGGGGGGGGGGGW